MFISLPFMYFHMDNPWNLHQNWIIVPSYITSISISYCSLSKQNQFQGLGAHMQRVHTDVPNEFTVIQTKVKSPKVFDYLYTGPINILKENSNIKLYQNWKLLNHNGIDKSNLWILSVIGGYWFSHISAIFTKIRSHLVLCTLCEFSNLFHSCPCLTPTIPI